MKASILIGLSLAFLGCNREKPEPLVHNALDSTVNVTLKSDVLRFTKKKIPSGEFTQVTSVRLVKGKLTAIDPEWLELEIPAEGETAAHKNWIRVSEVVSVEIAP